MATLKDHILARQHRAVQLEDLSRELAEEVGKKISVDTFEVTCDGVDADELMSVLQSDDVKKFFKDLIREVLNEELVK